MPIILAILGGLLTICNSVVGRVLIALGLSYVTYTGFDTGITWILNAIKANVGAMPTDIINFLAYMWVDKAIGLLFSAYTATMALKVAGSSSITKLIRK